MDSSALIALLHGEPGASVARPFALRAAISTVNWVEVVQRGLERGSGIDELRRDAEVLRLQIVPFDIELAEDAARLRTLTRTFGLSLGDRACLALARRSGAAAVTADRAWTRLDLGIRIETIR